MGGFYPGDEQGDASWGSFILFLLLILALSGCAMWYRSCHAPDGTATEDDS